MGWAFGPTEIERQRRGFIPAYGNAIGNRRQQSSRAESPFHLMPQSLSMVVIHVIFSTKDRMSLINPPVRANLHGYLATVARNADCEAYRIGGVADHVHLALRLSRTCTIADLVEELKTSSSRWLKTQSPALAKFAWQRGYACFSVGPTDIPALCKYIDQQEEHHRKRTFQEEYVMFLKKYGVEHNEEYVWD
jgi:putative transposase